MKAFPIKELLTLLLLSVSLFFSSINSLPVLDRDEARFAQATKQMIEQNNYFSIKFQNEYRSKKPPGIYWLQSISVNILSKIEELGDKSFHIINNSIWKYRIISAISCLLSILLFFYMNKQIFSKKIAFYSSIILSSNILFIAEAHIAKTDATLLFCTILVYLTLFNYFLGIKEKKQTINFILLWGGLSLSILIKGPILLILVILTVLTISIKKKEIHWILQSKPVLGILIVIISTTMWFSLLSPQEQYNFINESILHDFLGKVLRAQENHSAFIGFYSLSFFVFFFPYTIFIFPTIHYLKNQFKDRKIFFLVSWVLPCLIVMELVPTKLPHYILPIYPAISILVGLTLVKYKESKVFFFTNYAYFGYLVYFIISNSLLFILHKTLEVYSDAYKHYLIELLILFVLNNVFVIFLIRRKIKLLFFFLIGYATIFTLFLYLKILPNLNKIWISENISNSLKMETEYDYNKKISVLGYNEPSLIFELGTDTRVFYNIENFLSSYKEYDYLIIEKNYYINFIEIVNNTELSYIKIKKLEGFNAAKGKWIEIYILKKQKNR